MTLAIFWIFSALLRFMSGRGETSEGILRCIRPPRRREVVTAELSQARPSPAEAPKAKGGRDRGQKMWKVDKISTVTKEEEDPAWKKSY